MVPEQRRSDLQPNIVTSSSRHFCATIDGWSSGPNVETRWRKYLAQVSFENPNVGIQKRPGFLLVGSYDMPCVYMPNRRRCLNKRFPSDLQNHFQSSLSYIPIKSNQIISHSNQQSAKQPYVPSNSHTVSTPPPSSFLYISSSPSTAAAPEHLSPIPTRFRSPAL